MIAVELAIKILEESKIHPTAQVMIDGSIPVDFEERFEVLYDKGFLLLKEKKNGKD